MDIDVMGFRRKKRSFVGGSCTCSCWCAAEGKEELLMMQKNKKRVTLSLLLLMMQKNKLKNYDVLLYLIIVYAGEEIFETRKLSILLCVLLRENEPI